MAALTARWRLLGELPGPGRTLLGSPRGQVAAIELGRRRRGGFSGTDALPMAIVGQAESYLRSGQAAAETSLLLAEGARLAVRRFLVAAVESGWDVHLAHLTGPPEVAAARRAARGSTQSPSWVRGAATRAARLADDPGPGVTVHRIDPSGPAEQVAADLAARVHPALDYCLCCADNDCECQATDVDATGRCACCARLACR